MMEGVQSGQLLLLDHGLCGLCHGLVQWTIRHDSHDRVVFGALQSELAARLLALHGHNAADLDSVFVVEPLASDQERLYRRAAAVARLLRQLGGFWGLVGRVIDRLPAGLTDWGYRQVAARRSRLFGKYDACPLPTPAQRAKFVA
jgi:predicted DCC family thiol-disulfide oxidoreductase YuxK